MASELHWCTCHDSNFTKRPYFPGYFCPTFSHTVEEKWQSDDDTKDSRIVSAEEFQEKNEETSDESQGKLLNAENKWSDKP